MDENQVSGYWCHRCSQMVNPIAQVDIKCPLCDGGFVEQVDPSSRERISHTLPHFLPEPTFTMLNPLLFGLLATGGSSYRRQTTPTEEDEESPDSENSTVTTDAAQRRQRSSADLIHLLQTLGARHSGGASNEMENQGARGQVIVINPFRPSLIIQTHDQRLSNSDGVAFGDYFIGPGLDLLLERLGENDPGGYGTLPARKEAVEAMPTVKIEEASICPVCLEEMEAGAEAREMPCKHRFHGGCLVPWLELHSSCPVCRFEMPSDERKARGLGNGGGDRVEGNGGSEDSGRRFWFPWSRPLSALFSYLSLRNDAGNGNSRSSGAAEN